MSEKSKVLVVDDKQVERVMMKRILSGTYEVIEAENGKEAFEILYERSTEITAVLLDIVMPEYDWYYFLERYHKAQMYQAIPVIVLTMEIDIETEIKCLGMGAWDFIRKPYDVDVVRFRLKNVIGSSSQNISKALKYRAEYDILTGIYNKTHMFQATSSMLERYPDRHFAFVRMDIEKFQLINSFFGMSAGDMLLKYIADLLICAVRNRSDVTFGRMDADIFCFCVSYENTKELVESFDKMRDILSRYPLDFDIVPIFGVYLIAGKKITPDHMYDRANLAAKHCKGNYIRNYAFYTRQMSQEIEKEQRIVNSMKSALENHEFVVFYQPVVDVRTGECSSCEALVRWDSKALGFMGPGDFIPLAEYLGLITSIGDYVLEEACRQCRYWNEHGIPDFHINVNLSVVQLLQKDVAETVARILKKTGVNPKNIVLEITESFAINDMDRVLDIIKGIKKLGPRIALDDFGTGYSSLNYIKQLPLDIIKVDKTFIDDIVEDEYAQAFIKLIVELSDTIDTDIIVEGVENEAQLNILKELGVDYIQGFYYGKPVPAYEFEKLNFRGKIDYENADKEW